MRSHAPSLMTFNCRKKTRVSNYAPVFQDVFDEEEVDDLLACALERGVSILTLIHDCVMDDLAK